MKTSKILFPTDLSDRSNAALNVATAIAKQLNAKLVIVHVEEPPDIYAQRSCWAIEPTREDLQKMLREVVPDDPEVAFDHRLVAARPVDGIVELAQRERATMIVMTTHGRTGIARVILGSVAEGVLRHSPCPVLTVKESDIRLQARCAASHTDRALMHGH